ncbi:hypothetical protein C7N43_25670 [Sphingobacteriales bacterium UPWRP_1]|nr:hypothetical protein B6N25_12400 [Sphingobacteriales bacterium TSM_CSS]PSJ74134.1 hypothetical protein C7N43_25670 [Sphingobacteriales bacterium UPWRP_1]
MLHLFMASLRYCYIYKPRHLCINANFINILSNLLTTILANLFLPVIHNPCTQNGLFHKVIHKSIALQYCFYFVFP